MPALDVIPSGSQYDNLRGILSILKRDFPSLYSGLSTSRVRGWVSEIDSGTGREDDQIRDDIAQHVIGVDRLMETYGLRRDEAELVIVGGNEGGINFSSLTPPDRDDGGGDEPDEPYDPATGTLEEYQEAYARWRAAEDAYYAGERSTPPGRPPAPPVGYDDRESTLDGDDDDDDPPPPPPPPPEPEPEPVDWRARVRALYPWLPDNLVGMFADEWADTGDRQLALATVRASKEYDQAFPGIKRDDGSLRMTEQEWFSTREAYSRLFQDFGLNDTLFTDRFTELMEGEVSPQELAGRLGAAYEMINNQLPEVAQEFREFYGGNSEAALFASFIDPDIGQAILDRRISVAQVAGEGKARGFDVDESFAGRLVSGGMGQEFARNFFVQAEGQLQTLDDLARRHRDPDDDFDLEEFAQANVFGDASQTRRIRRLLRAEASTFTDQLGSVASDGSALTGLTPR